MDVQGGGRKERKTKEELTQACDYWPDQAESVNSHPAVLKQQAQSFTISPAHLANTTTDNVEYDGGRGW